MNEKRIAPDDTCECGHVFEEHDADSWCTVENCPCEYFEPVDPAAPAPGETAIPCSVCNGTGWDRTYAVAGADICEACDGAGVVAAPAPGETRHE